MKVAIYRYGILQSDMEIHGIRPNLDRTICGEIKNLIAQGGSQGGALALIAAGLDSRITAVAATHPALSDMAGYKADRVGGYPHLFNKFSGMD